MKPRRARTIVSTIVRRGWPRVFGGERHKPLQGDSQEPVSARRNRAPNRPVVAYVAALAVARIGTTFPAEADVAQNFAQASAS